MTKATIGGLRSFRLSGNAEWEEGPVRLDARADHLAAKNRLMSRLTARPDEVGSTETYVISVTNQGSAVGTNIRVTCEVQPEAEFVSGDTRFKVTMTSDQLTGPPVEETESTRFYE